MSNLFTARFLARCALIGAAASQLVKAADRDSVTTSTSLADSDPGPHLEARVSRVRQQNKLLRSPGAPSGSLQLAVRVRTMTQTPSRPTSESGWLARRLTCPPSRPAARKRSESEKFSNECVSKNRSGSGKCICLAQT
jgi:hypothetical protein